MIGAKITNNQAELINGKQWSADSFFNAMRDVNDTWYISEEEVRGCNITEFGWVNNLELTEITPKTMSLNPTLWENIKNWFKL